MRNLLLLIFLLFVAVIFWLLYLNLPEGNLAAGLASAAALIGAIANAIRMFMPPTPPPPPPPPAPPAQREQDPAGKI